MTAEAASPPVSRGELTLTADGITKHYGQRLVLDSVGFQLLRGELVSLVGPNGAGKTTLLSVLANVVRPDAGEVSFGGGAKRIGWVPQQPAVYPKLTVAENLRLFANLEGISDVDTAVARMLEQTALGDRANDLVGRLSGGNKQRMNIAVGLIADPPVLLLDEPSSALDPRQRERLWEFVLGLVGRGTSVLYSTHIVEEAALHSDRLLVLAGGELLYDGGPAELLHEAGGGKDSDRALVRFLEQRGQ